MEAALVAEAAAGVVDPAYGSISLSFLDRPEHGPHASHSLPVVIQSN